MSKPITVNYNPVALKTIRLAKGLTQKALATLVDAPERTYQRWEAGVYVPDGNYMLRLQIALSCSAVDLAEE